MRQTKPREVAVAVEVEIKYDYDLSETGPDFRELNRHSHVPIFLTTRLTLSLVVNEHIALSCLPKG